MDSNPIVNSREIRVSNLFNYRPNIQIQSAIGMGETDYYNNANYNSDSKFINLLVNYIDKNNYTALDYALSLKKLDYISPLLEFGAVFSQNIFNGYRSSKF